MSIFDWRFETCYNVRAVQITLPPLTPDQIEYLDKINRAGRVYDPTVVIRGNPGGGGGGG